MGGSAMGMAMRMGVEIVAALGIGFFMGWALDEWLGTRPWFMLVGLVFGAGAGMLNVYRIASGYSYHAGYSVDEETGGDKDDDGEDQEDQKDDERDQDDGVDGASRPRNQE